MKFVIVGVIALAALVNCQSPCTTPNGESAQCISIYNCKVFLDALKNRTPAVIRFFRESQCGYREDPLVCCGSVAHYSAVATAPPATSTPGSVTSAPTLLTHRNLPLLPKVENSECGVQGLTEKVFGGRATGIDEYPWLALLEYRTNSGGLTHSCGGVLISERYVLTAGHCIVGEIKDVIGTIYRVRMGEYDTSKLEDCVEKEEEDGTISRDCADPHQDIEVEESIVHKDYDPRASNRFHDIALLRLKHNITRNDFVRPICLPLRGERSSAGENVTVSGWGLTEKGVGSQIKLKADLPVMAPNLCAQRYQSIFGVPIAETQLCAGGLKGVDSCEGDSGGPVVRTLPGRSEFFVEGVVSYGSNICGTEGLPGVYTRVSQYLDWILDNMKP